MKKTHLCGIFVFIAAAAVIIAAAAIAAIPTCSGRLEYSASFYFVCYKSADEAHSAASVSSTVQSYGGAGYIVKLEDSYYVTVACYYDRADADKVCSSMTEEGLACSVVEAYAGGYDLPRALYGKAEELSGALNTLYGVGTIFYQTANAIDSGTASYDAVLSVLSDARGTLEKVAQDNVDNALGGEAEYLVALADDLSGDRILSRELRALQIAVCDCIINLNFFQ